MAPKAGSGDNVKVAVRCRPLNDKEIKQGHNVTVHCDAKRGTIVVTNPNPRGDEVPKTFTFDDVFPPEISQMDVYNSSARPIVEAVLSGYNGTIFAYGQTGTGKTHTMEGVRSVPELRGIVPNSFAHIFGHVAKADGKARFLVRVSYLEVYMEEIRDLLAPEQNKRLELKENPETGVYVKDLSSFVVKSASELDNLMTNGNKNRVVGATHMNEHSSRSHAILTLTIECIENGPDGKEHLRMGKLNMVDLAGSERQSKTGATGDRFKEAAKINLSLSTLGNVIASLVNGASHVPYRDSKLTRLLQDSLGGNAKTLMIANVGPASYNYDETLNTLAYANRAKNIKNKPKINEDPKDAMLREFQQEIERLKMELENAEGGGGGGGGDDDDDDGGD
eukprot:Opistho-2@39130